MVRVAIVVQRYGEEVVGGAESHARLVCERLVSDLGWEVEVFTSCALDYRSWRDHYPSGRAKKNGVWINRFSSQIKRSRLVFAIYNRMFCFLLAFCTKLGWHKNSIIRFFEHIWFVLQGPYVPDLGKALQGSLDRFEKVFFYTYLYYPTIANIKACGAKAVLIPTAHDEAALYFPVIKEMFSYVPLILANTEVERDLIKNLNPTKPINAYIAGMGIEFKSADRDDKQASPRLYLIYLGRIGRSKQIDQLLADFAQYRRVDDQVDLHLAGEIEKGFVIPDQIGVKYVGFLGENEKFYAIKNCLAVINPSYLESLSLIVLEGLSLRRPALVTGKNSLFSYYAKIIPSVSLYSDASDLSNQIRHLLKSRNSESFQANLALSQKWVKTNYNWQKVLSVYTDSISPIS